MLNPEGINPFSDEFLNLYILVFSIFDHFSHRFSFKTINAGTKIIFPAKIMFFEKWTGSGCETRTCHSWTFVTSTNSSSICSRTSPPWSITRFDKKIIVFLNKHCLLKHRIRNDDLFRMGLDTQLFFSVFDKNWIIEILTICLWTRFPSSSSCGIIAWAGRRSSPPVPSVSPRAAKARSFSWAIASVSLSRRVILRSRFIASWSIPPQDITAKSPPSPDRIKRKITKSKTTINHKSSIIS